MGELPLRALFIIPNYGYCIQKSISLFLCQQSLRGCARPPVEADAHKQLLSVGQVLGSFAQRYVKRHAPVRERAETRRLRWFLSPDFNAVFGATAAGIRNPSSDTSHSRGRLVCSQNPGIGNGGIWAGCLGGNPEKHVPQLCSEIGVPV